MWESEWVISSITGLSDCVRLVKFAGHPSKYRSHDLPNLAHMCIYFFPHREKFSSLRLPRLFSNNTQDSTFSAYLLSITSHSIDQCKLSYIFFHPFKSKHWNDDNNIKVFFSQLSRPWRIYLSGWPSPAICYLPVYFVWPHTAFVFLFTHLLREVSCWRRYNNNVGLPLCHLALWFNIIM